MRSSDQPFPRRLWSRRGQTSGCTATGSGKACPPDLNTASCNEGPCSASQRSVAPASSSHGFVSRLFHPRHSFESSQGEQAACVLDKTQAFIDLVVDVFKCTKWSGKVGESCYPLSGEHLVQHVQDHSHGQEKETNTLERYGCGAAAKL